jgi:hypothetical protein
MSVLNHNDSATGRGRSIEGLKELIDERFRVLRIGWSCERIARANGEHRKENQDRDSHVHFATFSAEA